MLGDVLKSKRALSSGTEGAQETVAREEKTRKIQILLDYQFTRTILPTLGF